MRKLILAQIDGETLNYPLSRPLDENIIPIWAIISALVVVTGACMFCGYFFRAMYLCIEMLFIIFNIDQEHVGNLNAMRANYAILASLTVVLALVVVSTGYFRADARTARNPIFPIFENSFICFVVSIIRSRFLYFNQVPYIYIYALPYNPS